MIRRILNYLHALEDRQEVAIALSKGAAGLAERRIDLRQPGSWEFSGFSQNGEDGILDVLRSQLSQNNRYFMEIGASDGLENNTSWLAIAEKYSGLMVEGNPGLAERARRIIGEHSVTVECHAAFVTRETVPDLRKLALVSDPDVFSLDIDGNDYHIVKQLLTEGLRPKILVVEFNAVYGASQSLTIPYRADFAYRSAHPTHLYYGVSIRGWRNFLEPAGYRFVTVDRNGVNAFFVDPSHFSAAFLESVQPLEFTENRFQQMKFRMPSSEQFRLIADQAFISI
jgi:hypothetical protein